LDEVAKEIKEQIKDVKKLVASRPIELDAGEPSKQAIVSALVCEYFCLLLSTD